MPKTRSLFVVLSRADLERTAGALLKRLPIATLEVPAEPRRLEDIMRHLGATRREQLTRGALALSGTSDKKSRAYKSARRRLERYSTGGRERRAAKPSALAQIAQRIRRPHLPTDADLLVSMTADVIYVGQTKTMPAGYAQTVTARSLGKVRDALRAGDELAAAERLLDAWVLAYGLNDHDEADGVIGNIEAIQIEVDE